MLLVRTYVASSQIHGVGLFAGEALIAGQRWWALDPRFDQIFSEERYAELPTPAREFINTYGYKTQEGYVLSADHDRFVNHSPSPNANEGYILRDILAGEEITENYAAFDLRFRNNEGVACLAK